MNDSTATPPQFRLAGPDADRTNIATWHLCARVYLDPVFRDLVLNDYYEREDRALAPDPGIDSELVVRHANHARVINANVMALTLFTGLVLTLFQTLASSLILAACCLWWLAAAALAQRAFAGSALRMETYSAANLLVGLWRFIGLTAAGGALLTAGLLLGWDRRLWPVLLQLAVLGAISAAGGCYRAVRIALIPNGSPPPAIQSRRLARMEAARRAEVVVHRSEDRPFVGFGIPGQLRRTILPLEAPGGGAAPERVDLEILLKELWTRTEALAAVSADRRLPLLEVSEHAFAADSAISEPIRWVRELVVDGRAYESFADLRSAPADAVRPYMRIQVAQRGGEVVTNLFLRIERRVDSLVIDFVPCHLLPTLAKFRIFETGRAQIAPLACCAAVFGFLAMPLTAFQAPFSAVKTALRLSARGTRRLRAMARSTGRKCGARQGIRQESSDLRENSPNEEGESELMAELLIRHSMRVIRDYLRDKIDVAPLEGDLGRGVHYTFHNSGELAVGAIGPNCQINTGAIGSGSRGVVDRVRDWFRP